MAPPGSLRDSRKACNWSMCVCSPSSLCNNGRHPLDLICEQHYYTLVWSSGHQGLWHWSYPINFWSGFSLFTETVNDPRISRAHHIRAKQTLFVLLTCHTVSAELACWNKAANKALRLLRRPLLVKVSIHTAIWHQRRWNENILHSPFSDRVHVYLEEAQSENRHSLEQ